MTTLNPRRRRLFVAILAIALACCFTPSLAQAQDATATPTPASDTATTGTVLVQTLNVRTGPGTSFDRLDVVRAGDILLVNGQSGECDWLYVETPAGVAAWVSGNRRYVRLGVDCVDIPTVDVESAAIVTPPPSAVDDAAAEPAPAETPVAPATATPEVLFYGTVVPVDKGCIAWGNYVGPEIIVDATHWETKEIIKMTLPDNEVTVKCYTPGRWAITMSLITTSHRDLNFDVEINAGDTFDWPFVRG